MHQTHQYTIEHIYHFTCGKCLQWWSYAQKGPTIHDFFKRNFTCPHCGHAERIKYKTWPTSSRSPQATHSPSSR